MPTIQSLYPNIVFGTSCVRALVSQLTDEVVYVFTMTFIRYLRENNLGEMGGVSYSHTISGQAVQVSVLHAPWQSIMRGCAWNMPRGSDTRLGIACSSDCRPRYLGHRQSYPVRPQRYQILYGLWGNPETR